ncbi:glycosyltransferase family 2 protein [Treponema denticola]|uniref:glycosyltransferase family 2 protein n=1 Tax=Treponema denticola TaxID=158 RepID=UPI0020A318F2|nr:glycosyltransferase family 2 protein [Treponema denticola]UTC82992.1 glycosyltransferase family 2 protein [Treponema denticola]
MSFISRAARFGRAARQKPPVSLCVPVYGTEGLIGRFFESVLQQTDSPPVETIVVNDGSPGTKELRSIVKTYTKRFKAQGVPLVFLEHSKNLGTLEARRTAVNAASGEYFAFADPDDELPPDALRILYDAAVTSGADIVHGKAAVCGMEGEPDARVAAFAQRAQNVYDGVLTGNEILRTYIVEHSYSSFVWGKLFKTDLVQKAYGDIPFTYCTMAEDMLLYFFITLYADKYIGIPDIVYNYRINTGLTSRRQITDLAAWQKVCSASSVFTILFSYLDDHPAIGSDIREAVRDLGRAHYADNLKQLEICVVPSLQEEARAMLEEWWGMHNL